MTKQLIVTREGLAAMLDTTDEEKRIRILGRALVAIFRRQTEDEKQKNDTENRNSVGFSSTDARVGSIAAKYYLKHGTLLPFQVEEWTRPVRNFPKICKYARQLNEVAIEKAAKTERVS